jgi:hypothetical protein
MLPASILAVAFVCSGIVVSAPAQATPVGPTGYAYAVNESQHITQAGTFDAAFGVNGKFVFKYGVVNGIDCTIAAFGSDPAPFQTKACFVHLVTGPGYGYLFGAGEGQHLTLSGLSDVAYGGAGKYVFKYGISGGVDCTTTAFGSDPTPFVPKDCFVKPAVGPNGFDYAGPEGNTVSLSKVSEVAFGGSGHYIYKYGVTTGIACTVAAFGSDPWPNVKKDCFVKQDIGPKGFKYLVNEGTQPVLPGISDVAFGIKGHFVFKYGVVGTVNCSIAGFGSDPAPYIKKDCYVKPDIGPAGYTFAAGQGMSVLLAKTSDVAYGAKGNFVFKHSVSGTLNCTTATFGIDPLPGVKKDCYVKPV